MKKLWKKWFLLVVCLFFLTSCRTIDWSPINESIQNWKYADVRVLDAIDTAEPGQDLIALYSRMNDRTVQLRVDFLEMPIAREQDIYFLFDTNPGGPSQVNTSHSLNFVADINWDYLIKIPGTGNVMIYDDQYNPVEGMALLIIREPSLDSLLLRFNKNTLPISISRTYMQVIVTSPGNNQILDKSTVFSMDAPSPARAKVLFVFWNTFSSSTPAQALRSWAGAHAGPMSSRHGLKYLLEAANQTEISLYLPDLFTPENISALDYLGSLSVINNSIDKGIVAVEQNNKDVNNEFSFINGNNDLLIWMNILVIGNDYAQFLKNELCFSNQYIISHDLYRDYLQSCKRLLLEYALDLPSLPLVLGGDFSTSLLGDPNLSFELFGYIETHPWVQALSISNLSNNGTLGQKIFNEIIQIHGVTKLPTIEREGTSTIRDEISNSLRHLPENKVTDLANYVYQSLTQPASESLLRLQTNYIGQIGFLINAAEWVNESKNIISCDLDLDYDGQNECILANTDLYVVIDLDGGYIPFVFTVDSMGAHQIVGPTWEFLVGISDNSEWNYSNGLFSDPGQILGAFSDDIRNWNKYNYVLEKNKIELYSENMAIRKSLSITHNAILVEVSYNVTKASNFFIPLVIDPWVRFNPGWGDLFTGEKFKSGYRWGISSGVKVEINTSMPFNISAFNDTRLAFSNNENPNFDYTRGHYLPFPMALADIRAANDFTVDIVITR